MWLELRKAPYARNDQEGQSPAPEKSVEWGPAVSGRGRLQLLLLRLQTQPVRQRPQFSGLGPTEDLSRAGALFGRTESGRRPSCKLSSKMRVWNRCAFSPLFHHLFHHSRVVPRALLRSAHVFAWYVTVQLVNSGKAPLRTPDNYIIFLHPLKAFQVIQLCWFDSFPFMTGHISETYTVLQLYPHSH